MDTDTSVSSSEVLTSDMEEDISIKNSKASSKKHSSKSIFITDDDVSNETYLDNFDEEDYLSWVSHTKGKSFNALINYVLILNMATFLSRKQRLCITKNCPI